MTASNVSAGLLLYRRGPQGLEVLLAHPGGPFYRNKDAGHWSIPKGIPEEGESDLLAVARREFQEETGLAAREPFLPLGQVRQKSGKVVHAWAFEGDVPPDFVPASNTFEMEWPPRSGRRASFPEIDRAELFPIEEARRRINAAQVALLDALLDRLVAQAL
jgi:predicted NUDIX family NTP pyrophosphohydrolase